jgi:hypothetical protein
LYRILGGGIVVIIYTAVDFSLAVTNDILFHLLPFS